MIAAQLETGIAGRGHMTEREQGYDYDRYRKLLAEATDESKRLALIDLLIEEGARDQWTVFVHKRSEGRAHISFAISFIPATG